MSDTRLGAPSPTLPAVNGATPGTRLEFPYLDGLRGIAALTVVLYHAYLFTGHTGDAARDLPWVGWVVGYGHLGVPVFIVLSGYVLMLPVVTSHQLKVPGGFTRYIKRRARRILPPYYVALLLSLALIAAVPALQVAAGTQWDTKVPVTVGGVVSHLLLLHDLRPQWIGQVNGPLWSVAVEWHIYFLMPLLLLPLWRRIGPLPATAVTLVATFALGIFADRLAHLHVWLVGLFACGMLAAHATVNDSWRLSWLPTAARLGGAALIVVLIGAHDLAQHRSAITGTAVGVYVAAGLVVLGRSVADGRRTAVMRLLETKPAMQLGLMSYSIYLLHSPLLGLANLLTLGWELPTWGQYSFLTMVVVPLDLLVCAGFYALVERRFMTQRQHRAAEVARGLP